MPAYAAVNDLPQHSLKNKAVNALPIVISDQITGRNNNAPCSKFGIAVAAKQAEFTFLPSTANYRFDVHESDEDVYSNNYVTIDQKDHGHSSCVLNVGKRHQPFDYYVDHQLYKYKEELKIFQFILHQVRLSYNNCCNFNSSPVQIDEGAQNHFPTDVQLLQSQKKRFGLLDYESTKRRRKEFEIFKRNVYEEYTRWIKNANEILQEAHFNFVGHKGGPKYLEYLLHKLTEEMDPMIPRCLSKKKPNPSPNVLISEIEPYVLPRQCPKKIIKSCMRQSKNQNGTNKNEVAAQVDDDDDEDEEGDGTKYICTGELNLAFIDPIVDHYRRLRLACHLNYPLVKTMLKLLSRYPLGMTPTALYNEFRRKHSYEIDFQALGFPTFEDMLRQNSCIFNVIKGQESNLILVFPAFLEVHQNVDAMQKKICHWLLVMLTILNRPVRVKEVTKLLNRMFHLGLNVKGWDLSEEMYYQTLVPTWSPNRIDLCYLTGEADGDKSNISLYLKLLPSSMSRDFERAADDDDSAMTMASVEMSAVFSSRSLNSKNLVKLEKYLSKFKTLGDSSIFVGFKLPSIADSLKRGLMYKASTDFLLSPNLFNVSLQNLKSERDDFISAMKKFYNEKSNASKLRILDPEFLYPGVFVAVRFDGYWARGQIVKKKKEKSRFAYKVFVVDTGVYKRGVKAQDMLHLHVDFCGFPIQSFPVRLERKKMEAAFGRKSVREGVWPEDMNEFFSDRTLDKHFVISPTRRSSRDRVWEVSLHLIDSTNEIMKPDLCDMLAQRFLSYPSVTELLSVKKTIKIIEEQEKKRTYYDEVY